MAQFLPSKIVVCCVYCKKLKLCALRKRFQQRSKTLSQVQTDFPDIRIKTLNKVQRHKDIKTIETILMTSLRILKKNFSLFVSLKTKITSQNLGSFQGEYQ